VINLTTGNVTVPTTNGNLHPEKFLFINPDGNFETTVFTEDLLLEQNGRSYSGALIPEGTGFKGFLMDTDLVESMFTRMFFFKGHNLECFELFDFKTTVTGDDIYVWKIDWDCTDPYVVFVNSSFGVTEEVTEEEIVTEETEEITEEAPTETTEEIIEEATEE